MLKYQLIANQIENTIYENNLPKGTKLPTVEQLACDYNVSKSTIVKALESLVLKGIVYQVQGSGIFVRRKNRKGYINLTSPRGFTDNLTENKITSKVLDFQLIDANEEISELIECDKGDPIYMVKIIRYIDGNIMCYEESYYKKSIIPFLSKEIVEKSIYEYLESAFNISTSFQDMYLNVTTLNEEFAQLLELNVNDPALVSDNQCYLSSGIIFNYSKIIYHYKNTQFYDQTTSIK